MNAYLPLPCPSDNDRPVIQRLSAGLASMHGRLRAMLDELDRRRRIECLLDHDDRMLDDMGLDRFRVEEALKLPLRVNALEALNQERRR